MIIRKKHNLKEKEHIVIAEHEEEGSDKYDRLDPNEEQDVEESTTLNRKLDLKIKKYDKKVFSGRKHTN